MRGLLRSASRSRRELLTGDGGRGQDGGRAVLRIGSSRTAATLVARLGGDGPGGCDG